MILDGHADDLEDGELAGASLVWRSDRLGRLGTGPQLALPGLTLEPGWHEITLTATDSDGQTGVASVRIFVGELVRLPLVLRNR